MKITIDTKDPVEDLRIAKELIEKVIAGRLGHPSEGTSPDPSPGAFSMFDEAPASQPKEESVPESQGQPQVQLY